MLRDIVRTMGGPKDSRVQALLEKNREDIRQFRRGIRSAQGDVRAALARTPHDEEALKTALAALRKRTSAAQKRAQSALVELSKQLTDEERRALRENRAKGSNDGAESDTEDRSDDDARQP